MWCPVPGLTIPGIPLADRYPFSPGPALHVYATGLVARYGSSLRSAVYRGPLYRVGGASEAPIRQGRLLAQTHYDCQEKAVNNRNLA